MSDAPTDVPLSLVQEGLWFLAEADPDSTVAYCLPWRRTFHGRFDADAFEAALNDLVARHESLRATFGADDRGTPYQRIAAAASVDLARVDVTADPRRCAALVAENEDTGFDVTTGPLLRGAILRTAPDEHVVTLAFHHLVIDGASIGVFESELATAYAARAAGAAPDLPPMSTRYRDYATDQRTWVTGDAAAAQAGFWRDTLAGIPPLELDLPRPGRGTAFDGAPVPVELDEAVTPAVRTLCRTERAAPFMVLLAGFGLLLAHHNAHPVTAVGLPVAGRRRPELASVVGMFVNMLAIPVDPLGERTTFREAVRRVRDRVTRAYANQELPFSRVVAELGGTRQGDRNPVFQAMFDFLDERRAPASWPDLRVEPVTRDQTATRFDLELLLASTDGRIAGKLVHSRRAVSGPDAARLAEQYAELMRRVTADPDLLAADALAALDLGGQDRESLLELSAGPPALIGPSTVPDLLDARVTADPGAVAVEGAGVRLTYGELGARVNRMARELVARGVGPEVVVGVLVPRSVRYVETVAAVLVAGGVYLPLDVDDPALRTDRLVAEGGAALVLTDGAAAPSGVEVLDLAVCDVSHRDGGRVTDADRTAPLTPDHAAYVLFTSGSTGTPKGVAVTHAAICPRLVYSPAHLGTGPGERVLQKTPYSFDVSVAEMFGPLVGGATLVVAPPDLHRDPAGLAAAIVAERISVVHFVPSMLALFLDEPDAAGCGEVLRLVMASGEALSGALVDRALDVLGVELVNLYGPTEAAVEVTATRCEAGRPVTIGRPLPGVRTYVLGDRGDLLPTGVAGHLHLAGPQVARGYVNDPQATAESFRDDPFGPPGSRMYRTGDLARWTGRGELEYLGRVDDQVKVGGIRVEPGEVGEVVGAHPAVATARAVARRGPAGTSLVVYVVPADPAAGDPTSDVRAWVADRLPAPLRPSQYVVLAAFPLTRNGKVDVAALPAAPAPEETDVEPTATERALLDIFEDVLEQRIAAGTDFFAAGGNSLAAIRVIRTVRRTLHPEATVRDLFDEPTARGLAAVIEGVTR